MKIVSKDHIRAFNQNFLKFNLPKFWFKMNTDLEMNFSYEILLENKNEKIPFLAKNIWIFERNWKFELAQNSICGICVATYMHEKIVLYQTELNWAEPKLFFDLQYSSLHLLYDVTNRSCMIHDLHDPWRHLWNAVKQISG